MKGYVRKVVKVLNKWAFAKMILCGSREELVLIDTELLRARARINERLASLSAHTEDIKQVETHGGIM